MKRRRRLDSFTSQVNAASASIAFSVTCYVVTNQISLYKITKASIECFYFKKIPTNSLFAIKINCTPQIHSKPIIS